MKDRILVLTAIVALAACSGGSSSAPLTPGNPRLPGQGQPQSASVKLSFPVASTGTHASVRKPFYVSPNVSTIVVTINSIDGSTTLPSWVAPTTTVTLSTASGGNCTVTGGIETCIFQVPAPPGAVNYTFTIKDASNNDLATLTQTFTIAQGVSNTLSVTLQGVVNPFRSPALR